MSIDELRHAVDLALENAVGPDYSKRIDVWVESRAHRFDFSPIWETAYSITVEREGGDDPFYFYRCRASTEAVYDEFRRTVVPRVASRCANESHAVGA